MNVLGCLDRPTAGSYWVNGIDTARLDADALAQLRRNTFGFIFQRYNLMADLSAVENAAIPAVYAGMSEVNRTSRAVELLKQLGLGTACTTAESAVRRSAAARQHRARPDERCSNDSRG